MYNSQIKGRFLDTFSNQAYRKSARTILERVEPGEVLVGKDVAEMSESEATLAISKMEIFSVDTIRAQKSMIGIYVRWCRDNNIFPDVQDGFCQAFDDSLDISPQLREKCFRNENHLVSEIQRVCGLVGRWEPSAICLYWLGLSKSEVLTLGDDQVDLENRIIMDSQGNSIVTEIPDIIVDVFSDFVNEEVGERVTPKAKFLVYKDMTVHSFLKRFYPYGSDKVGSYMRQTTINSAIRLLNDMYISLGNPGRFNYQNIVRSGNLRRLYQLESSGKIDLENQPAVLRVFRGDSNYKNILWLYRAYKRAFNL